MKIRARTLLIFFAAVAALFVAVVLLSDGIILRKFLELSETAGGDSAVIRDAGERTVRVFLVTFAATGGILFFLLWFLLDGSIFAPIHRLGARLQRAARVRELPSDLGFPGSGEIATLARSIEELAKSLAAAQADYRAVVEEQTDLIFRYAPDRRVTFANRALGAFLGRGPEELIGSSVGDLFGGAGVDLAERIAGLEVGFPAFSIEHEVDGPDGKPRWLARTDRGKFGPDGRLIEVQSVVRDVTENRVAQQVLEESERRYRGFFEAAADGIMILSADDERIQDVNPGLCALFGYERHHFLDKVFWQIAPFSALSPVWLAEESERVEDGVARVAAVKLRDLDGRTIFTDITVVRYRAGNREVVQWNFRNVTAQRKSDDALRALSGRLLRAQDDERRRIARELHDSTGQNLSALEMNLSMLTTALGNVEGPAARLLEDSRSLADRCCSEIRTISYLLHPPLLDEAGLVFALKWFAEGFARRSGIAADLDVPENLPRLPAEVESTLFRVAQEALTNIHRHSGATRAVIRMTWEAPEVQLEVRDNGKGMDPAQVRAANRADAVLGVGLAGMRQRVVQLGGTLAVTSGPLGTAVRAGLRGG